jgi:hypothetical protein
MSKFTVSVKAAWDFYPECDEHSVLVVTNRAGRSWVSKKIEDAFSGMAEENGMVLQEMLDGGEKLDVDQWTEVA